LRNNIIANILGKLWSVLSGFLFIPLYINFLGFENYSLISFTLIIAGMMAVLDAGLTATLLREFARKDQTIEEKRRIFATLETCYFFIVIFVSISIYLLSEFIAVNFLNLGMIEPHRVSLLIKIFGFEAAVQMLFRFYIGGVLGMERQVKANMLQIGWGVCRNGLIVLALFFIPTLEMFFTWQLIWTIVFTAIMRTFVSRILTDRYYLKFHLVLEKKIFTKVWRFAGGMLLISLVTALNSQMDKLAISKLLNLTTLGYYTLAASIATGIYILISPISVAVLPRFTALYSNNKKNEAADLFNKVNILVVLPVSSVMAIMIFFGKELIWIWTGDIDLALNAAIFLPTLAFSFMMVALTSIPFDIAIANGYTKLSNILGIISLFLTLPGYWFATKLYGGMGAAFVYCFVQTIVTIIYLYLINQKFLNFKVYDLMIKKISFPILVAVGIAYIFSLVPNIFIESRALSLVWIGLATIATLSCTIMIFLPLSRFRHICKLS